MAFAHNIGIQMNQKELTYFWWFQIENNPLVSTVYTKLFQHFKGWLLTIVYCSCYPQL